MSKLRKYSVVIERTAPRYKTVTVLAKNRDEAEKSALGVAGSVEFNDTEKTADYEVVSIDPVKEGA